MSKPPLVFDNRISDLIKKESEFKIMPLNDEESMYYLRLRSAQIIKKSAGLVKKMDKNHKEYLRIIEKKKSK